MIVADIADDLQAQLEDLYTEIEAELGRDLKVDEKESIADQFLEGLDDDATANEFNPDQPRVPAGGPGGGQFGSGGGGATGVAAPATGEGKTSGYTPAKTPERWAITKDTTYEGVPKEKAATLTPDECKKALEFKDGMTTVVGSNAANSGLPKETRPDLDTLQSGALQKYSFKNDGPLNGMLRRGDCCYSYTKDGNKADSPYTKTFFDEMHGAMQSAFEKAPVLSTPVKVVRGMNLTQPGALEKFTANVTEALASGKPLSFNGYTSTAKPSGLMAKMGLASGIPSAFKGNVSLKINAVHGLDMGPHSQLPTEKEILLNHGAQFTVKSITKKADGYHVELDQLHPSKHREDKIIGNRNVANSNPEGHNQYTDTGGAFKASSMSEFSAAKQMNEHLEKHINSDVMEQINPDSNILDGVGTHNKQIVFPIGKGLYVVDRGKEGAKYTESLRKVEPEEVQPHPHVSGFQKASFMGTSTKHF